MQALKLNSTSSRNSKNATDMFQASALFLAPAWLICITHWAICTAASPREITTPAQVWERAIAEPNSRANEAIDLFCAFLGSAAGNLALILGARGGIYIGGGIIPRMGDRFDQSPFRARFEAKGRFKNYLEKIPTWVISSPVSPALQGASQALSLGIW